jgi:hypothetical protein
MQPAPVASYADINKYLKVLIYSTKYAMASLPIGERVGVRGGTSSRDFNPSP